MIRGGWYRSAGTAALLDKLVDTQLALLKIRFNNKPKLLKILLHWKNPCRLKT